MTENNDLLGSPHSENKTEIKAIVAPLNDSKAVDILELKESIKGLGEAFEIKIKYDTAKEAQINKLHAELQEYKSGLYLNILKPIVLDLITMHDNFGKLIYERSKSLSSDELKLYSGIQTDIEDILYRYGFECFSTDADVVDFDSKRQRIAKTSVTNDESKDRKISERLRKGFTYQGLLIRPEFVNVYTYKPDVPI
jgi:molecular chaperone GrpE